MARALAGGLLFILPSCHIPKLRHAESGPFMPLGYKAPASPEPIKQASHIEPAEPNAIVSVQPVAAQEAVEALGPPKPAATETTSLDDCSLLGIDAFYYDPLLTRLIHQAIGDNRELKILDEEIQIARNEILSRRGAYLPFVNVGGGAGTERPSLFTPQGAVEDQLDVLPGQPFPNPLSNYRLGFDVFWQLDIWGQLRNSRDAAVQRFEAASERRNFFVTKLVAEVAENYYRLMALDKRIENLDKTIAIQEQSLEIAKARKAAGRDTELPVQRFQAEVRKNQSEKLIVRQEIVEVENRINFLVNRFPEPVERASAGFFDLTISTLSAGVPSQLLQNRPDVRQAERELAASGLDVQVARARFFPTLIMTGGVGYEAFNPKYLFNPDALVASVVGNIAAPLINKKAIQADYMSANARQLQAVYNYQRIILNAFTEVVNRLSMVENYGKSIDIKKQQLEALEASVDSAGKLFQNARVEYIDVLFAQRDLMDARMVLIDTKNEQLGAIVNAYQALGGGDVLRGSVPEPTQPHGWGGLLEVWHFHRQASQDLASEQESARAIRH